MPLTNFTDLLVSQLSDMHNAETQLIRALPVMAGAASSASLSAAFAQHLIETRAHAQRLEQAFTLLQKTPLNRVCKAMEGLIAEGDAIIAEGGEIAIVDAALITAAQRVEHYEISAYGSMKALADTLGLDQIVRLLDQTLEEEKAADVKLTMIAEAEVNLAAASASTSA